MRAVSCLIYKLYTLCAIVRSGKRFRKSGREDVTLFVFWAKYAAFMDGTDRIYHLTHSADQSRTEGARDSLARGHQVA